MDENLECFCSGDGVITESEGEDSCKCDQDWKRYYVKEFVTEYNSSMYDSYIYQYTDGSGDSVTVIITDECIKCYGVGAVLLEGNCVCADKSKSERL